MTQHLEKLAVATQTRNGDADWLRFPIAWAETGEFGTLLISPEAWRGLAYCYDAAGAPDGQPSSHIWLYRWNETRGFFEPYTRIEPHHPTIWGSLAWSGWWAWVPSLYATVFFYAITRPAEDPAPITDSQFLAVFVPTMCLLWGFVHWLRWLGRRPR